VLSQVVYETNADWAASQEAMVRNDLVIVDVTAKGLLWFRFIDNRTVFLLSPSGKLQVKWNDVSEKRTLFRLLRNLLVPRPNQKLSITPKKQQTWIDYPVPNSFKLYWCDTETEFVLKTPSEKGNGEKQNPCEMSNPEWMAVVDAVEELRRELRFFREPTFNEVAMKSGCLDSVTLRIGLSLAGWKEQSPEEARWVAKQAIELAGWLQFRKCGDLNPALVALAREAVDSASLKAIGRAQVILKNCPDLVPKVNGTKLKWPDETRMEWIRIFGGEPPAQPACDDRGITG
jgi:hypothetical protein